MKKVNSFHVWTAWMSSECNTCLFFTHSVSLLANLPDDKLSKIVDCLEVVSYSVKLLQVCVVLQYCSTLRELLSKYHCIPLHWFHLHVVPPTAL